MKTVRILILLSVVIALLVPGIAAAQSGSNPEAVTTVSITGAIDPTAKVDTTTTKVVITYASGEIVTYSKVKSATTDATTQDIPTPTNGIQQLVVITIEEKFDAANSRTTTHTLSGNTAKAYKLWGPVPSVAPTAALEVVTTVSITGAIDPTAKVDTTTTKVVITYASGEIVTYSKVKSATTDATTQDIPTPTNGIQQLVVITIEEKFDAANSRTTTHTLSGNTAKAYKLWGPIPGHAEIVIPETGNGGGEGDPESLYAVSTADAPSPIIAFLRSLPILGALFR